MSLAFKHKTETIEFGEGNEITVRGLALPDITILVDTHRETVSALFDRFTGRDPKTITTDDAAQALPEIVAAFPSIACHVIALGADVPERYSEVLKLPLDVQITALERIVTFTFQTMGGSKKLAETVLSLATGANRLVGDLKTLSPRT